MKANKLQLFRKIICNQLTLICCIVFAITLKANAQKDFKAIEQSLNKAIDSAYINYKVPGIIVGIWMPEFTYTKTIGKGDLKTGAERNFDDKIRIGSITKTF